MTNAFKPHLKTLPVEQRRLWPQLQPASALGFTLYGGTAIALRLGHRISVDFDFFSDKSIESSAIQEAFPFMKESTVTRKQDNTLKASVPDKDTNNKPVLLSFFSTIDFGRVGHPAVTDDGIMYVASLEDLMATKLAVILQRVSAKDYQDIAAMIDAGVSLSHGLGSARALYGLSFQPSESLKALIYFKGGDLEVLTTKEKSILGNAVRKVHDIPNVPILSKSLTP